MSQDGKTMLEKASEGVSGIGQTFSNAAESATTAYNGAKESVSNTLDEFSSKNVINASSGFLNSNGIIAKFLFLILVLFGFVFFFYLGMQIIGFFTGSASSVYVISGLIPDMKAYNVVLTTDSTKSMSDRNVPIARSNNQTTGLEFTWCSWLNLKPVSAINTGDKFNLIYVKGSGLSATSSLNKIDASLNVSTTNCPGVYVYNNNNSNNANIKNVDNSNNTSNMISIMIDTVTTSISSQNVAALPSNTQIINISNIPINKWFHLAIRCQNKSIDVYINGIIYVRSVLAQPPRQNSDNIHVCDSNPANGSISDLRYFAYALSVVDINGIVNRGPNLTLNAGYAKSGANNGGRFTNASYLANSWYNKY
jgi:hypothetical protein